MEHQFSAPEMVLVVEDSPEIARLMELTLRIEGYDVCRAENAAQALELARSERLDLMLLDVMLPDASGFEVAQQLQSAAETADLLIIFVTARADLESVLQGLELGVDYITKPFAVPELAARVNTALRQKRRYQR